MYVYEDSKDPVQQMNAELQHAQLELISAHCSTYQLRLHYSAADLARFGRRDVLRKSAEAASALHEFYASVEKSIPASGPNCPPPDPTPAQIEEAVGWLSTYLQQQRAHYLPVAGALSPQHKSMMRPYFSLELLEQVRVLDLRGARVAVPPFFAQIRAAGFEPPEISHMDSLTFQEVVVFNQELTLRALFHALVHSIQIQILGIHRYCELWVQSFVRTKTHFTVPLEVHAFSLASKFLSPVVEKFSVAEQVLRWKAEGRY